VMVLFNQIGPVKVMKNQNHKSGFIESVSNISSESGNGSRVLITKNLKKNDS